MFSVFFPSRHGYHRLKHNVLYKERHYLQAAKNLLQNQITVDQ